MILINCLLYDDKSNFGYREYVRNLMFLYSHSSNNEIFLFRRSQRDNIENFCNENNIQISSNYMNDYLWRIKLLFLPIFFLKNIKTIINTFNYGPLINLSIKNSLVIHDFKYKYPMYEPRLFFRLQRNFFIFFHHLFYEKIFCISESTKLDYVKFYGQRSKIEVKYNFLNIDKYKDIGISESLMMKNAKYVMCISSDLPYKNIQYLVDEFNIYKNNNNSNLKLLIIGTNKFNKFKDIVSVDKALQAEVNRSFKAASAIIQPSLFEGFGFPYIEASIFNKLIVAIDIPIAREICDPMNSIFINGERDELQDIFKRVDSNEIEHFIKSKHIHKFCNKNLKY